MKDKVKIKESKVAVIKVGGKVVLCKKADKKGLLIEGDLSVFELSEKEEKDLTTEEKRKMK